MLQSELLAKLAELLTDVAVILAIVPILFADKVCV